MCDQRQGLEGLRLEARPSENDLTPACAACSPDKLFGKRLLQVGRYLVSHKAWMKTVPTENCDVLMTFPGTCLCSPAQGLHRIPPSRAPLSLLARAIGPCAPWQIRPMTTRCYGC